MYAVKSRHQAGGQSFLTAALSTKTVSRASYRNRGQMSIRITYAPRKNQDTRRASDALAGAKAQRPTASMTFMMLGRALEWFTEICSRSYVCRPPQGMGLLSSIRRARPLIMLARE